MANFMVNSDALRAEAGKLEQQAANYRAAAAKASNAAEALRPKWEGDAKDAFYQQFDKAISWYNDMAALVETYAITLKTAADTYDQKDAAAAQAIKQR